MKRLVLSLFGFFILGVNVASAAPTWTVNSLDTIGCASGATGFTVATAGTTGAEHWRTQVDSGGLRYMDEDAGVASDGTFAWHLYTSSSGGPTTGSWPIPGGQPIIVNFMLISGSGGPTVYWRQVTLSQCNGGSIVSNVVILGPGSPYCSGFTDVPAAAGYCNAVDYLKNRAITLGCASSPDTPMYCPNDYVTRASMALFMNRLGNALSPQTIRVDTPPGAVNIDGTSPVIACQTGDFAVAANSYPRKAIINTTFAGHASAALEYQHEVYVSTDGGTTWTFTNQNINRNGASASHWVSSNTMFIQDLAVGTTYRWGVRLGRQSGVGNFDDSRCFINVEILSRTGSSSPYDSTPVESTPRVQPDH